MTVEKILAKIASDIRRLHNDSRVFVVAIDGPDGAGKSMFATRLANYLRKIDVPVVHTSIDGFHRPKEERYIRGRNSPEGFYRDSYDYDRFKEVLLDPIRDGGDRYVRMAIHDVNTDKQLSPDFVLIQPRTVLIVDGIFLHRDELYEYWDYSIFLDVDFQQTFRRMSQRDNSSPDPYDELNTRYREGQLLYFQECHPKTRATIVIDNNDFRNPKIII